MRRVSLWGAVAALATTALIPATAAAAGGNGWHPAAKGGLDCNGFSPVQTTYRQLWCTEIAANDENGFEDNGHYVGHDEPDIGFFSFRHGSANSMSYKTIAAASIRSAAGGAASAARRTIFELTPAIWFGLTMCDNESYPEGTKVCTPRQRHATSRCRRGPTTPARRSWSCSSIRPATRRSSRATRSTGAPR